jgi:hypothetical protein
VLVGKLKVIIIEEAVHQDDAIAHSGDHGSEWFFAGGPEAQIKRLEDAIISGGAQGGIVTIGAAVTRTIGRRAGQQPKQRDK